MLVSYCRKVSQVVIFWDFLRNLRNVQLPFQNSSMYWAELFNSYCKVPLNNMKVIDLIFLPKSGI